MITEEILEKARLHVRTWFSQRMPAHMRFHDLEHTLSVTRAAIDIGRNCSLGTSRLRLLELAALFHDTGYALAYKGHEAKSALLAERFLRKHHADLQTIVHVRALIMATRLPAKPKDLLQRILRDADSSKVGQADFDEKSERLRAELEHVTGTKTGKLEWLGQNIRFLEQHRFHTPYAEKRYAQQKRLNLRDQHTQARLPKKQVKRPKTTIDPFFDRDLSWLAFNHRVLQEAHDPRVPLLERLKFLAIHSSNLDEFYRVRVASLRSLGKLGKQDRTALGVPPEKLVERINAEVLRQQRQFGTLYRQTLLPALVRKGIHLLDPSDLDAGQKAHLRRVFREHIAARLRTAAVKKENAQFVEDRKLYLVCRLRHRQKKKIKLVLVNVPSDELGRFMVLPSKKKGTHIVFLDDVVRAGLPNYFKGYQLLDAHSIKLSRDADLYLDEEFAETVADRVRRSLRKRRTGVPSRFLYDQHLPEPMLGAIRQMLDLKKNDVVPGGRYHNLSDLMKLPANERQGLRDKPLLPVVHPTFDPAKNPFATLRKEDVMLHFPFHDFGMLSGLIERATVDPRVERISLTIYRVGDRSRICEALIAATKKGKHVTVFVEVQARFDEKSNLQWGEQLEKAGARVIYSLEGLKVHAKLLLIDRREQGRIHRYAYLGTGNFHERNAKIYSDTALLTGNPVITREVAEVFKYLEDPKHKPRTEHLMLAPFGLRSGIERAIDREMRNASQGRAAGVLLKLNNLEDKALITKLYDASRAGVDVHLIVRGICCLVPGVRGSSERINAVAIVDRFLEHSRAYVFHNGGNPQVFLSSADLMTRNMDRRIEVAFPITHPGSRDEVLQMLALQWNDPQKARIIDASLANAYKRPRKGRHGASAQVAFHGWLLKRSTPTRSAKKR